MNELPRGMRLNNPCNIEISKNHWQGKITPSVDPVFEQFGSIEDGLRAAIIELKNYQLLDGITTIGNIKDEEGNLVKQGFIPRWAPPSDDNPTGAYVTNVCSDAGVGPNDIFNVLVPSNMCTIIGSIVRQEQGSRSYVAPQTILFVVNDVLKPYYNP